MTPLEDATPREDYTPLDLSAICNADPADMSQYPATVATFEAPQPPLRGAQSFHGIPFHIGSPHAHAGPCFVLLGGQDPAVHLPLAGQSALHVIFAHRQLDSRLLEGGPLGEVVAHYVVGYADGTTVRLPIRERFEIATVPTAWGQLPFLAVPDQPDGLPARYAGAWGEAGDRLTEVASRAGPTPTSCGPGRTRIPARPITALIIEPAGPAFLLAAVTLGHLDEEPFCRTGRPHAQASPSRSPRTRRAPSPSAWPSIAAWPPSPMPLPAAPASAFCPGACPASGTQANAGSSPAYVQVAATPSATLRWRWAHEPVGHVRWGDAGGGGAQHAEPTPARGGDRPGAQLGADHGAGRRRPASRVPCRVHFRSPEGVPYAPHGHHAHLNGEHGYLAYRRGRRRAPGRVTYAYIDGRCEGWLPRGEVLVDVARGFEYEPLRTAVHIEPGQQELTLRLKRWCDMNAQRYFSGDTHVHFLSTQGAQLEARGEDLNVVNLLLSQWGHLFTNTEEWTGQPHRLAAMAAPSSTPPRRTASTCWAT